MNEQQALAAAQQRRASYRVPVAPGSALRIRAWRIGPHAHFRDKPSAKLEVNCEPRDLCVSGMGLNCRGRDNQPLAALACGERLRLQVSWENQEAVIEAHVSHTAEADLDGWTRTGVVFKKLDKSIEGRRTKALLESLVGSLQRAETRRRRLGLNT